MGKPNLVQKNNLIWTLQPLGTLDKNIKHIHYEYHDATIVMRDLHYTSLMKNTSSDSSSDEYTKNEHETHNMIFGTRNTH